MYPKGTEAKFLKGPTEPGSTLRSYTRKTRIGGGGNDVTGHWFSEVTGGEKKEKIKNHWNSREWGNSAAQGGE